MQGRRGCSRGGMLGFWGRLLRLSLVSGCVCRVVDGAYGKEGWRMDECVTNYACMMNKL